MLEFIIKYWVQWVFGLVALGLGAVAKHYASLYKKSKEYTEKEHDEKIHQDIEDGMRKTTEDVLQRVMEIKGDTAKSSLEKYENVVSRLEKHEKEAAEQYERMFTTISQDLLEFEKVSDLKDAEIQQDVNQMHDSVNILKGGILNIQGRDFKNACRELLKPDHEITESEYEDICEDHMIYNSLGGNHKGDALFAAVEEKYKKNL